MLGGCWAGTAGAQDFSAGKTAAQLFSSDCSACHTSPRGLAKGRDARSLATFLQEHYTTKQESAATLAAFLTAAGPGDTRLRGEAATTTTTGPKTRARNGEGEGEVKPEGEGETASREEPNKRNARTQAVRENEPIVAKLNFYASARGPARDTQRMATATKNLESYATSGAPAAVEAGAAAAKQKDAEKKKKKGKDESASAGAHEAHPVRRPAAQNAGPQSGNN